MCAHHELLLVDNSRLYQLTATVNMPSNPFLLPAFIGFDTLRAILLYSAVQSDAKISLTFVTFWWVSSVAKRLKCSY